MNAKQNMSSFTLAIHLLENFSKLQIAESQIAGSEIAIDFLLLNKIPTIKQLLLNSICTLLDSNFFEMILLKL